MLHRIRLQGIQWNRAASRYCRPLRTHTDRHVVLGLEALEGRLMPSTFSVSTTADSGAGSLRQAITDANANPGADTITFSVSGTIALQSALPDVRDNLSINGPGASVLLIEASGSKGYSILTFDTGTTDQVSGLTLTNSDLADAGGGVNNAGTLTVQACGLAGNTVNQAGGAIYSTGTLTVADSRIANNTAFPHGINAVQGGGIYSAGTLTVTDSVIENNVSEGSNPSVGTGTFAEGGGVFIASGSASITGTTFTENSAEGGTAGRAGGAESAFGGAVYLASGSLNMVNDTLAGNIADIGNGFSGTPSNGTAQGGGIYAGPGTLSAVNLTITSNLAGALPGQSVGTSALGQGGGIFNAATTVTFTNTILAGNRSLSSGPDGQGIVGGDFNLIQNASGLTLSGATSHTIIGQDPRLGNLQNNGGPTPTEALLAGSPAIDAGTTTGAPRTDQRGFPRGIPDIGAYEAHPWIQAIADQSTPENTPLTVNFTIGDQALFATEPITGITATSDNQLLVPNGNIQITGSSTSRTLTITPVTMQTGFANITVTVSAGSQSMSDTFRVLVTPIHLQTIAGVAEGTSSVVFVVTPDHGLKRFDKTTGWVTIGGAGTIQSVTAAPQPLTTGSSSVNAVAFVVTTDHALDRYDDVKGWQPIGAPGTIQSASAGNDRNGLADVFVLTTKNELTEWSTSGGWLASPIGAAGSILQFSALSSDRVDVVAADHSVDRFGPTTGWFSLTSPDFALAVSSTADGTTFAQTLNGGLARHAGSTGSPWIPLGAANTISDISAGSDATGQSEVFALTTNDDFAEYSLRNGWQLVGATGTVASFSASNGGRAFAILTDGAVAVYDDAAGWMSLSGPGLGLA